jgi:hypothetical protein
MASEMIILELQSCSFSFMITGGKGINHVYAVSFEVAVSGSYYSMWGNGSLIEEGYTDRPHTVNGAKVLVIDHILKFNKDEDSRVV